MQKTRLARGFEASNACAALCRRPSVFSTASSVDCTPNETREKPPFCKLPQKRRRDCAGVGLHGNLRAAKTEAGRGPILDFQQAAGTTASA